MKRAAIITVLIVALCGCQKPQPAEEAAAATPASSAAAPAPPAGGGSSTVQQYTPTNIGGATPVQGSESLDGAGSAAGNILKDRARHLPGASQGAPPAAPTEGGDPAGQ